MRIHQWVLKLIRKMVRFVQSSICVIRMQENIQCYKGLKLNMDPLSFFLKPLVCFTYGSLNSVTTTADRHSPGLILILQEVSSSAPYLGQAVRCLHPDSVEAVVILNGVCEGLASRRSGKVLQGSYGLEHKWDNVKWLGQDCCISSALALEIL